MFLKRTEIKQTLMLKFSIDDLRSIYNTHVLKGSSGYVRFLRSQYWQYPSNDTNFIAGVKFRTCKTP